MNIFKKAKLALRKHLLENKVQTKKDLQGLREISDGNDSYTNQNN